MSRRSALLLALTVGVAGVVTLLLLARRGHAINAASAPPAPRVLPAAAPAAPTAPAAPPAQAATGEQPLPTWVRVAIVAAALLAFLAVSMIATRSS